MPFVTLGLPNHDTIPGVSANDHHTPTVAGDLNLADLLERNHASLAAVTIDQHHARSHQETHGLGGTGSLGVATHFALVRLFGH